MLNERGHRLKVSRRWCGAGALALLAACTPHRVEPGSGAVTVAGVPFFPQAPRQCGPASLASLLAFFGRPVAPERLAAELVEPGARGTTTVAMATYGTRHGVPLQAIAGDRSVVRTQVRAGHPLVVLLRYGIVFSDYHFVVITGYDERSGTVYGYSGRNATAHWTADDFARRWAAADQWALIWTGDDEQPATAAPHPRAGDEDHAESGEGE